MIQSFFIVLESCLKHLRVLCGIGTRCVHHREPGPMGMNNSPLKKFDLGQFQILLLFPVVLKFLPLLANSIYIATVVHI